MKRYSTVRKSWNPQQYRIIIVGTVRDCGKELRNSLPDIIRLAREFEQYKIILYENDSKDDTINVVNKFTKKDPNIILINEENIPGKRTERIAHGRNILVNEVRKKYNDHNFMIMMDLDYNPPNILKSLRDVVEKIPDHWGAATAVSSYGYYDWWALRCSELGLTHDCWNAPKEELDKIRCPERQCAGLRHGAGYHCAWGKFAQQLKSKNQKVESAFNGVGIYRINMIPPDAKYEGRDEKGEEVCEHVSFNKKIPNIYIFPELVTSTWDSG